MNTLATYYQNLGLTLSLLVIATFLLAGMIKGVIGLGLPTIAMGLLGLAMAPSQAAALLIIPATVTNVWQLAFGGHLSKLLQRLWPMLLAICVGSIARPSRPMAMVGRPRPITPLIMPASRKVPTTSRDKARPRFW